MYQLTDKIDFGKYSNRTFRDIISFDPNYIDWCITNISDFFIGYEFIKEAVIINPYFSLSSETCIILDEKFSLCFCPFTTTKSEIQTYLKEYRTYLTLEARQHHLKNRKELLNELEIKYKEQEIKDLNDIKLDQYRKELESDRLENLRYDETNWSKYNEDLGWGEQSEDFWNQF